MLLFFFLFILTRFLVFICSEIKKNNEKQTLIGSNAEKLLASSFQNMDLNVGKCVCSV